MDGALASYKCGCISYKKLFGIKVLIPITVLRLFEKLEGKPAWVLAI